MSKDYFKKVKAVCDFLMEDNNFGVKIPEVNEKLECIGFTKLMDEMKKEDNFNAEPYLVFIDMLDRTGQDILTNAERRQLEKAKEDKEVKMPKDKCYRVYLDKYLNKGTYMKVHILLNRLNNYALRSRDFTKEQWSKELNSLKYAMGDKVTNKMKVAKINYDNLTETEIEKDDIMNPVKVDYRTRTISVIGYDKNHIETLALPTTPDYFKESYTGHISAFLHMCIEDTLVGRGDVFYKVMTGDVDVKMAVMFLFLEIERRLANDNSIQEYLKPVYDINIISESNYVVGRANPNTLFVVYRCDGIILIEEKYVDKVLLPKGVSVDKEGVVITYSNNKPIWDLVFPIYKPKTGNYNWIADINRIK